MAQEHGKNNAFEPWGWMIRYVVVIILALILAAALGHMSLFEKTSLGGKMTASNLVQFLGYGAALALLWMIARQSTIVVMQLGGKLLAVQHLILPAATLLVVALAYPVLLLLIKPFMGSTLTSVVNWLFILSILACSGWLVAAVFNQSAALTEFLTGKKSRAR